MIFFRVIGIILFTTIFSCEHPSKWEDVCVKNIHKDSVYLIFRGTESKEGGIAKRFNIQHKDVSHVGILLYEQKQWVVFHVLNKYKKKSCLHKESIGSFLDKTKEKIDYLAVYYTPFFDKSKIREKIKEISKEEISFNYTFVNDSPTKLYCSQFVVNVLKDSIQKFNYYKKYISNPQHRIFIKKDTIEHYPVDMFFYDNRFYKKYEWTKENNESQ